MKSELTRERLQTGLLRIPASLPALLRSPGSLLGLESVPTRNMGPAQCRSSAWLHPCLEAVTGSGGSNRICSWVRQPGKEGVSHSGFN